MFFFFSKIGAKQKSTSLSSNPSPLMYSKTAKKRALWLSFIGKRWTFNAPPTRSTKPSTLMDEQEENDSPEPRSKRWERKMNVWEPSWQKSVQLSRTCTWRTIRNELNIIDCQYNKYPFWNNWSFITNWLLVSIEVYLPIIIMQTLY